MINLFPEKYALPVDVGKFIALQTSMVLRNGDVVLMMASKRYGHRGTSASSSVRLSWLLLSQSLSSELQVTLC